MFNLGSKPMFDPKARIYPKEIKTYLLTQVLYVNVHSNFIQQLLKPGKCLSCEWIQ